MALIVIRLPHYTSPSPALRVLAIAPFQTRISYNVTCSLLKVKSVVACTQTRISYNNSPGDISVIWVVACTQTRISYNA